MTRLVSLLTPPLPRIVPDGVFDAFGWCQSGRLDWGGPTAGGTLDLATPITSDNPPGMVFVMKRDADFLPRELAALHVPGMELGDAWALAPWGIDDATDQLFAEKVSPSDLLWLATGSIAGLFWGLHDWAHFHNHGAFEPEQRAWTELQCDASALAWLWRNRSIAGVDDATWERVRREAVEVARARFDERGEPFDAAWLSAERARSLGG